MPMNVRTITTAVTSLPVIRQENHFYERVGPCVPIRPPGLEVFSAQYADVKDMSSNVMAHLQLNLAKSYIWRQMLKNNELFSKLLTYIVPRKCANENAALLFIVVNSSLNKLYST